MCGIFGQMNSDGRPVDRHACRLATRLLHHRGPDASGEWISPADSTVYLGFRRLSILDLSDAANQPMHGENGNVLIFNGEIYNYRELRKVCEGRGRQFRTHGDTEVLLAALELWGAGALTRLEGMFALLFWNAAKREALIARDPLGIKPLYFWRRPGAGLCVASEIKSFYALPEFTPQLRSAALPEYLRFRTLADGETLLQGVDQLNPGHFIRYQPAGDRFELCRYWSIAAALDGHKPQETLDLDGLRSLFRETVDRHLLSDVPVGAQLSGGVDSTLSLAVASRDLGRVMRAFHCSVDKATHSEYEWASRTAEILRVEMASITLDGATLLSDLLERLTWHMDEPLGHPNAAGVHMVSKLARPKATVLISGEGADEIFGGYVRYSSLLWQSKFRGLGVRNLAFGPGWARKASRLAAMPEDEAICSLSEFVPLDTVRRILPGATEENTAGARLARIGRFSGRSASTRAQLYDLETYLPALCIRQDKMSMAASIENRVPFLTPRMAVFGLSLARKDRASYAEQKVLLKRYLCDYMPKEVVYRKKVGFQLPLEDWLWNHPAGRDRMADLGRLRGHLDVGGVLQALAPRDETATELAWVLLTLDIWLGIFLNKSRVLEFGSVEAAA
jgi:asparagine synthase (glutamine-hydrolysing)